MSTSDEVTRLAAITRDIVNGLVREDGRDLSVRQLGILLICYLDDGPHRMRDLADRLDVGRPAITRCVDRLVLLHLASRTVDPLDRRSLLVGRTPAGAAYMATLQGLAQSAAGGGDTGNKAPPARPTR